MRKKCVFNSKMGCLQIVQENKFIVEIGFCEECEISPQTPLLKQAKQQLEEYFAGERKCFSFPIHFDGTPFQQKVWKQLQQIEYGMVCSYAEIAKRIGTPKAYRAVGMANNKNPLGIVLPCHRVVGKNGELVGYAAGIERKEQLLKLEQKYKKRIDRK